MDAFTEECATVARVVASRYHVGGYTYEDLCQEASLGVLEALRNYRPGRLSFRNFAFLCADRRLVDLLRHSRRQRCRTLDESQSLNANYDLSGEGSEGAELVDCVQDTSCRDPLDVCLGREQARERLQRLQLLTSLERSCLVGRSAEAYEDTATRLGVSLKSVDNAVQRAKLKLAA